jgi:hypothetical protein
MAPDELSVELARVNLTRQNQVCAFFNTMDEEHRVLGSFDKGGFDRGEKATHVVASENREAYLKKRHRLDWLLLDKPAVNNSVEYKARLNYVPSKYNAPVICDYDLSKFSASVAMDIMPTHPLVIIAGLRRENPSFVPPDQFFKELRERPSARLTAGS